MASAYLSKTFSSGNQKTFTFSGWFKFAGISSDMEIFGLGTASNDASTFSFVKSTGGTLRVDLWTQYIFETNRVLRDPSAWYHIVLRVDTTQATAGDRVRLYINGSEETSFSTENQPSQNTDFIINSANTHFLGVRDYSGTKSIYFDGSMTHIHFTDGYSYDASTFGETDSTSGIWKPKTAPSVTYGTNGFFLKMENSGAMGTDSSGNTNTFTVNGTITQNVDTPSNNFATLNPLNVPTSNAPTYSNGNNTVVTANGTSAYFGGTSSLGVSSGKWYTEFKISDATADAFTGITFDPAEDARNNRYPGQSSSGWGYFTNGYFYNNASSTAYGNSYTTGDIIGVAMDLDNAKLYFSKNGTFQNSGDPTSGATGTGAISITSGETYFFSCGDGTASSASTIQTNFGNGYFGTTAVASAGTAPSEGGIFEYDCPSGYQALCTKGINSF